MQSATSRSGAQSPPPITLPARTVAIGSPIARNACGDVLLRRPWRRSTGRRRRAGRPRGTGARCRRCGSTCRSSRRRSRRGVRGRAQRLQHLRRARRRSTVNVSTGLSRPRRTSDCAARWNTTSGRARATAARASLLERTSPRTSPAIPSATSATSYSDGSPTVSGAEAVHLRAERLQPERQPGALEARVAGQPHAPALPDGAGRSAPISLPRCSAQPLRGRADPVAHVDPAPPSRAAARPSPPTASGAGRRPRSSAGARARARRGRCPPPPSTTAAISATVRSSRRGDVEVLVEARSAMAGRGDDAVGDVVDVRQRPRLRRRRRRSAAARCPAATLRIRSGTAWAIPGSSSGISPGP